ncbi:MAG: ATP-dependent ligase, partial [Gammaproteobacteria bacterium]|nr:ATP-dependent ligase [Gammaproteobacteria bacterium]
MREAQVLAVRADVRMPPNDLRALPVRDVVLDGEVVVLGSNGISDFHLLQADIARRRTDRLEYYVFDVLYLEVFDLRS